MYKSRFMKLLPIIKTSKDVKSNVKTITARNLKPMEVIKEVEKKVEPVKEVETVKEEAIKEEILELVPEENPEYICGSEYVEGDDAVVQKEDVVSEIAETNSEMKSKKKRKRKNAK